MSSVPPLPSSTGDSAPPKRRRPTTLGEIVRSCIDEPWVFFTPADQPQSDTLRRGRLVSVDRGGLFAIADDGHDEVGSVFCSLKSLLDSG